MSPFFKLLKDRLVKSFARDKSVEPRLEAFSRFIWPWPELRLVYIVCCLAILDYVSTYAGLELSGKTDVYERGHIAGWALRMWGFKGLFLADLAIIGTIFLLAFGARFFYTKIGFKGLGRTAFVVLLLPYAIITTGVVLSNIVIALV